MYLYLYLYLYMPIWIHIHTHIHMDVHLCAGDELAEEHEALVARGARHAKGRAPCLRHGLGGLDRTRVGVTQPEGDWIPVGNRWQLSCRVGHPPARRALGLLQPIVGKSDGAGDAAKDVVDGRHELLSGDQLLRRHLCWCVYMKLVCMSSRTMVGTSFSAATSFCDVTLTA